MKNKLGVLVLLVSLLVLGLTVTGCNNGSGGGGGGGGDYVPPPPPTQYTMDWAAYRIRNTTYTQFISEMTAGGYPPDVQDTATPKKWALLKGSKATEVAEGAKKDFTPDNYETGVKGTLSELAEHKSSIAQADGFQVPDSVKNAIKGAVPPIFVIIDGSNGVIVMSYIR